MTTARASAPSRPGRDHRPGRATAPPGPRAFAATQPADLALRLLTEPEDPAVAAAARRVTERRIAVIEAAFTELGQLPAEAHHYANALYAAYLGTAALRRANAAPVDQDGYLTSLLQAFGIPPEASAEQAP
jgi:hypothetical protein